MSSKINSIISLEDENNTTTKLEVRLNGRTYTFICTNNQPSDLALESLAQAIIKYIK